ncbi:uncharacterized protein EKO05_0007459 [Ascochyta rabiei]|uniref:uncharacterized protein n=1 Tax=Didymella rabiei TaxID=5454 RepID=UPI00220BD230|nr:uncharacterized protein EKO05_0007459 [Ascochyta rabiei]UPX17083.1 hypothetical protein EKO05_0007459 [Ascochyta rabiei]
MMPLPKFSTAAPMYPSAQIIEDRYIDDEKLLEICKERFGWGNYKLKYKFNRWYLQAPCWLDEETLELCEIQYP